MRDQSFNHVSIKTEPGGQLKIVSTVDEALDFLIQHWPVPKSRKFNTARQSCLDALEGKQTVKAARSAFVKAAQESEIYVGEFTRPGT